MVNTLGKTVTCERRHSTRVDFHFPIRLIAHPSHHWQTARALSQNISQKGLQILSPVILQKETSFEIWIETDQGKVISANARTAWMDIEDTLGDSPYWLRCGLNIVFNNTNDQELVFQTIQQRSPLSQLTFFQKDSRIGFVF